MNDEILNEIKRKIQLKMDARVKEPNNSTINTAITQLVRKYVDLATGAVGNITTLGAAYNAEKVPLKEEKNVINHINVSQVEHSVPSIYKDFSQLKDPVHGDSNTFIDNITPECKERYENLKNYKRIFSPDGTKEYIFYQQIKFMEDFTDSYEYPYEVTHYYPSYNDLFAAELRGYFSWRTLLRHNVYKKASPTFFCVYCYEMLNNPNNLPPIEIYNKLCHFKQHYEKVDDRIGFYFESFSMDYIIYNDLPPSLLNQENYKLTNSMATLFKAYEDKDVHTFTTVLSSFSTYKVEKSKFYKEFPKDFDVVMFNIYRAFTSAYEKRKKLPFATRLFGSVRSDLWRPYKNAVVYNQKSTDKRQYVINSCEDYSYDGRVWRHNYYANMEVSSKKLLTAIIKSTDACMRKTYGCPYSLTCNVKLLKYESEIINNLVRIFATENARCDCYAVHKHDFYLQKPITEPSINPLPVEVDVSKLDEIRFSSKKIQEKLIVDEDETVEISLEVPENVVDVPSDDLLLPVEYAVIEALLVSSTNKATAVATANGMTLSIIVDSLNEKLFDLIDDNCIDYSNDTPIIVECYRKSIEEALKLHKTNGS